MSKRQSQIALLLLALGLLLRLVLPQILGGDPYRGDGADYQRYAHNLYHSGIYSGQLGDEISPEAGRMPGVPILIWAGMHFFEYDSYGMLLPNILFGWGILLLVHLFLGDLRIRKDLHLLALGIFALLPVTDYYAGQFYPEVPGAFFILLSLWSFFRFFRSKSGKWVLVSGLSLGLSLYFRPEFILILPLLLLFILLKKYSFRQKIIHSGVTVASVLMVLAPWTLRNLNELDAAMPLGNNFVIEDQYPEASTCSQGKYAWLNTWHFTEAHTKLGAWYFNQPAENPLPEFACDSPREKAMVDSLRQKASFTCGDDALMLSLAREKAAAHPMRQYLILPLKRCFFMLFRFGRMDSLGERAYLVAAWFGLAFLTGMVHLLGLLLPWVRGKLHGVTLLLWLILIECIAFFAWFYHVEHRYLISVYAIFFLLAVFGINRLLGKKKVHDNSGSPTNG